MEANRAIQPEILIEGSFQILQVLQAFISDLATMFFLCLFNFLMNSLLNVLVLAQIVTQSAQSVCRCLMPYNKSLKMSASDTLSGTYDLTSNEEDDTLSKKNLLIQ